jgi:hypothetical protein
VNYKQTPEACLKNDALPALGVNNQISFIYDCVADPALERAWFRPLESWLICLP